ncbi:hypothetical protein CRG98_042505 [Punica granatum]|uniref:Uncharacterized protein n=1 Tax=Punica granatum TaxID=22663 RepID=A0A2I0I0V2_PUNGR|nr:hypothetical protein CRG98_042505 [Punica granatum]
MFGEDHVLKHFSPYPALPLIKCLIFGSVREIDLPGQELRGTPPVELICRLRYLEKLAVGFNSLHGPVSVDLANCVKLRYLDLGSNLFISGPFPSTSAISELRYQYIDAGSFSGSFPWASFRNTGNVVVLSVGDNVEFHPRWGNLVDLHQLELYGNALTGKFPVGFGNLTELPYFHASMNQLEGDLSELRFMTKLDALVLFRNNFSGEVPREYGEFQKLINMSLCYNRLTGPLPHARGSWAEFNYIDVSGNF